jgi:succinoglycan biosynthesis transport protein ExoP
VIVSDRALSGAAESVQPLRLIAWHKWLVLAPIAIGLGLGWFVFKTTPSRYVAQAVLALDARNMEVIPSAAVISRLPQENPVLRTELDLISSRSMAESVLNRLPPSARAEMVEMIDPPDWLGTTIGNVTGYVAALFGGPLPSAEAAAGPSDIDLVDLMRSTVDVSNDGRSYTIFLTVTTASPDLAALLANTYADAYLAHQTSVQEAATQRASEWLGQKVEELRTKLEISEGLVGKLRREANLVPTTGPSLAEQRFAALNAEIAKARAARADAEAKLTTALELAATADNPHALDAFADVLNAPLIGRLREQMATYARSQQELEETGASNSPDLPALRIQQGALEKQIQLEMTRVVDSLRSDVTVSQRREKELQSALQQAIGEAASESQESIRLNQLEREASATRTIYETFLNRYKQTIEQEGFAAPEASLMTSAVPPGMPTSPRLPPLLAVGFIGGALTGFGLAFVREKMDGRIRNGRMIMEVTGGPIVGWLPKTGFSPRTPPQLHPLRKRESAFSHSVKKLQTAIILSRRMRKARVIAITSAGPGEGKSTVAVALARSLAVSGRRVILIDADVRKPAVARLMHIRPGFDLGDILKGHAELGDVVTQDPMSTAAVLPSARSADGLQSAGHDKTLEQIIGTLREIYDVIIIDTPPILTSADAAVVSALSDGAIFLLRWHRTTLDAAASAIRELHLCNIEILGVVVNRMNRTRHMHYAAGAAEPAEPGAVRAPASVHQLYG